MSLNSNLKNKQVHYILIGPETIESRRWIKCQSSHMSNTEKQAQQKSSNYQKCVSNSDPVLIINIIISMALYFHLFDRSSDNLD